MTAAAIPSVRHTSRNGLRPVNLQHDLAQIADLIELCFGPVLDRSGRDAVREMQTLGRHWPLLWLLTGLSGTLPSWGLGYVWEENGRVVGNISTQRSAAHSREWLIANVAVHPEYRRRGIARALTRAALAFARAEGGHTAILQVDDDNAAAIDLYRGLGFSRVTTRAVWSRSPGPVPAHALTGYDVRPSLGREWRDRYGLAQAVMPEGLTWNQPLRSSDFRPALTERASRFLTGQSREEWVVRRGDRTLIGGLTILTNDGGADTLTLLVHPEHRGSLERALLIRALRRLGRRPWPARFEYPAGLPASEAVFAELGFRAHRTLAWMKARL